MREKLNRYVIIQHEVITAFYVLLQTSDKNHLRPGTSVAQ